MITNNQLKELLNYNQHTGIFTWNLANSNRIKIGDMAGSLDASGYRQITINKKRYMAHRLAWLYINGEWPKNDIDHINGNRVDNRIENLRNVTHRENCQNYTIHRNGKLVGASFHKTANKWESKIRINGKREFLGYYNTDIEAHNAYMNYVKQLKGSTNE